MLFVLKGRGEEDIYEGEFGHLSLDLVNEAIKQIFHSSLSFELFVL